MDRERLRQDIVETAIAWETDRGNTTKRDMLIAAIQAYNGRRFYIAELRGSEAERTVILYDAGVEVPWAEMANVLRAQRLVVKLNEQLGLGWDPNAAP